MSCLSPEMSGSSVTEFEMGSNYCTARDLAPGEAGWLNTLRPGRRVTKETHNCCCAIPSLFLWSCQGEGGQGWSEAKLQSRKHWSLVVSTFPSPRAWAQESFPHLLRPLESDLPIFHFFYFLHPTWGELTGSLSCLPGPWPLLVWVALAGSVPELCVYVGK